MPAYEPSLIVQLRLRPFTGTWLLAKSAEAKLPPSTYVKRRLEELATEDLLQKGASDGDLQTQAE